jgi:hypothetical protein
MSLETKMKKRSGELDRLLFMDVSGVRADRPLHTTAIWGSGQFGAWLFAGC